MVATQEEAVSTVEDLMTALQHPSVKVIIIRGQLVDSPSIRLSPGQSVRGEDELASITFEDGAEGVQLSSDNALCTLQLHTTPDKRVIFNDTSVDSLGQIELRDVTTTGRVQILARDQVRSGHVAVQGLDILAADARGERDRPHGYGVYVLQGAFTLWNMQPEDEVVITADIVGVSAGRAAAPVLGSGVFVSGAGDSGVALSCSAWRPMRSIATERSPLVRQIRSLVASSRCTALM